MEEQNNQSKFGSDSSHLPPPPVPPSSGQYQPPFDMGQYQPQYNPPPMKTGNKNLGCIIGAVSVIVILILVIIAGILYITSKKDINKEITTEQKTTKQQKSITDSNDVNEGVRLYFCEEYDVDNSEEIGVSDKFTPGWLTVMLDMRDAGRTIGCKKVYLEIYKITDEEENKLYDEDETLTDKILRLLFGDTFFIFIAEYNLDGYDSWEDTVEDLMEDLWMTYWELHEA